MARGRPQKEIDQKFFENLCKMQCTLLEIAGALDVDDKTLSKWCRKTYGMNFSEVFSIKRQAGLVSLRRMQFKLAETSPQMAIHLGIQYLNQTTKDNWQRCYDEKLLELKKKKSEQEGW